MEPLSGVRVIETANFVNGPFAGMMLADLGADVIKVEQPGGDPFRRFGRVHNGQSIAFTNCNRNKRSTVLDLRTPGDRSAFERLLADADILLTNWRPKTARGLGLDAEGVRDRYPRLIWVRITGYGPSGPLADVAAFDGTVQARTGLAVAQGTAESPSLVKSWIADKVAAAFAVQAALAAVVARERTGRGAVIDVPMLDALAYFNFPDLLVERTLVADGSGASSLNDQLRAARVVRTQDGWIMISPVGGRQMKNALEALGRPDLKDELRSLPDPAAIASRFYEIAGELTPSLTTAAWLEIFDRFDVPAAPVLDLDAHLDDPQVRHNGIYEEYEDPRLGTIRQARHPARFDLERGAPSRPAPGVDEHRVELEAESRQ